MIEGYWLEISGDSLQTEQGYYPWTCSLKVKPVDAAFNILGAQAYDGYYVEHDFANNTMTFTPHSASVKRSLMKANQPSALLQVGSYAPFNGKVWAISIAAIFAIVCFAGAVFVAFLSEDNPTAIIILAGGFVGSIIVYFVIKWLMMLAFPGERDYYLAGPSDRAIVTPQVSATHLTVMGLLTLLLYKLCGKK